MLLCILVVLTTRMAWKIGVWVQDENGRTIERIIEVGQSNGSQIEVIAGNLLVSDQIYVPK